MGKKMSKKERKAKIREAKALEEKEAKKSREKNKAFSYFSSKKTFVDEDNENDEEFGFYSGYSYYSGYYNKTLGKSASSSWTKRFGGWGFSSGINREEKYRKIKNAITRSANLIRNKNSGEEKNLEIKWSSGDDLNRVQDNIVYLSPDVVDSSTTRKPKWSQEELTDVLIAQALIDSTMKRTASADAENLIDSQATKLETVLSEEELAAQIKYSDYLWYTCESIISRNEVIENYPGFADYFSAHLTYYTDENCKDSLENLLNNEKPSVNTAVLALIYNLLRPDAPLSIPSSYGGLIEKAQKNLRETKTSEERARSSIEIAREFIEKWFNPDEEGEGEGDKKDSTLEVGSLERSAVNASNFNDEEGEAVYKNLYTPEGELDYKNKVKINKIESDSENTRAYSEELKRLRPLINKLKSRLKLYKENFSHWDRGLKSGQIDDGSLHKLAFYKHGFRDNSLFERKDIQETPKTAIALLVDESGSMFAYERNGLMRCQIAQQSAIIIAKALDYLEGVNVCVLGHTAIRQHGNVLERLPLVIHEYYTPSSNSMSPLADIVKNTHGENYDGYAIEHTAKCLSDWFPEVETKIVIHLSDGEPSAPGYRGNPANSHVKRVCEKYKAKGIEVFTLGIGDLSKRDAQFMYGAANCAIIQNVSNLPQAMGNLITRYLAKVRS